jgi:hypothetical protein
VGALPRGGGRQAKVPRLSEHITLLKVIEAIYKSAADGKDMAL